MYESEFQMDNPEDSDMVLTAHLGNFHISLFYGNGP